MESSLRSSAKIKGSMRSGIIKTKTNVKGAIWKFSELYFKPKLGQKRTHTWKLLEDDCSSVQPTYKKLFGICMEAKIG